MTELTVTQADRDAAAVFFPEHLWRQEARNDIAQAFARHREQALAEGVAMGIDAAVQWAKDDAKICDCSAHSEGECACGAWCEWKTVPMVRVAQNLAELDPAAIIAQHRRAQAVSDLIAGDADLVCGTLGDSDGDDGA
jgi:hypothetical protein